MGINLVHKNDLAEQPFKHLLAALVPLRKIRLCLN